ncbi:MAG: hypothetical protein JSS89_08230 [Bacteroidetes bacterium]|nr:hypothetical protein [Bacteroidota bacterium]
MACSLVAGEDCQKPSVAARGTSLNDFIPNGWAILDSAVGDLNMDGHPDAVIVMQHIDSVPEVRLDPVGDRLETVMTHPRLLVVLMYRPAQHAYHLLEQNNSFIPQHDYPNMEDPYEDVSIVNGVLTFDFGVFYNVGSWTATRYSYKFQYRDNDILLVSADHFTVQRNTDEFESRHYDFVKRSVMVTQGNIETDCLVPIRRKIQLQTLRTLSSLSLPFTWEVEPGIRL